MQSGVWFSVVASSVSIKRFDVIYIDRHSLLLVMISNNGNVITKRLSIEMRISQLTATDLSMALNDHIAGLTANEITLPLHTKLTDEEADIVCENFAEVVKKYI